MATKEYRIKRDSMDEVRVPKSAYCGAQTQRAVEIFPISGVVSRLSSSMQWVWSNVPRLAPMRLSVCLDSQIFRTIREAAREVIAGKHDNEFVVDIFQTGSGTTTNRNANEVIANCGLELLGNSRQQGHTS